MSDQELLALWARRVHVATNLKPRIRMEFLDCIREFQHIDLESDIGQRTFQQLRMTLLTYGVEVRP